MFVVAAPAQPCGILDDELSRIRFMVSGMCIPYRDSPQDET